MGSLQANSNSSKNNRISIKKQNLGGGRLLLLKKFSPIDISGLSLWLKADAGVTVAGGVVTSWEDQSEQGNDATTSGGNPQLIASAINSKPAIQFNNVSESGAVYMTISSQFNLKNSSGFVVVKQNSTGSTFFARIMAFLPSSGEDYDSNDGMAFLFNNVDTRLQLTNNSNDAFSSNNQANGVFAITSYTINSSGLSKVFYNGIEGDGNFQNGSMSAQNGGNVYIAQGSQLAGEASALDGEIAEIIIYNRAITTQERQAVEVYLNAKYAIY